MSTLELIERFGARLNAGTLDTLHVALAQLSGCTWFLSFDTNSNARVLAASARPKVFPSLLPAEKAKVVGQGAAVPARRQPQPVRGAQRTDRPTFERA